jgi:RNA polymerase sigma factor (sigma-70 family)
VVKLEASTIHTPGALAPSRIAIGPTLLRLRSDEQLVALFRTGHDEAFQVIYDRYHKRLAGYARQMLPRGHDPDDVLQDVFVRAYRALRHDDRELAVRPWLFRVVHNCCIDELRRTIPVPTDDVSVPVCAMDDPAAQIDSRETLRRLIEDIGRLPEQQRSALLLRELSGISYEEVATILDTTVPAVKSLLVRARTGLVRAGEARDTACSEIREQIALAHDQGVRATPIVRRHLRDCQTCRSFRGQMRVVDRRMAALVPAGPLAALARLIGLPGGSATGALGAGGTASGGAALGANHVAALVAAAIASAGGAVGLQHVIASSGRAGPAIHRSHYARSHGPAATAATAAPGGSYQSSASEGTALPSSDPGSASGTGSVGAVGGGANSAAGNGAGGAGAGVPSAVSPTPTAPPGWVSTGPPPTARPTPNDTGPTPTTAGGDGSAGSPTPTTDPTGSTTTPGDPSGTGTTTATGSSGTTDPTSPTGAAPSATGDPSATTAVVSDGSTATDQSTSSAGTSGTSS